MTLWSLWISQAVAGGGGQGGDTHGGALVPPWEQLGMALAALVLFLAVLNKYARRPISDYMSGRALAVRSSLEAAGKLRSDAQTRFDEIEARLAGLDAQLTALRVEAEVQAQQEADLLERKAAVDAARIRAAAERTLKDELGRARHALRAELTAAAAELATQQIRSSITDDDRRRLDAELLETLRSREAR